MQRSKKQSSQHSLSDCDEIEFGSKEPNEKGETFAQKLPKLRESRELLRQFIELKGPNEQYNLDTKKYDHSIVDPRQLHVKTNRDILDLADSSIKKMYVNKKVKKNWSKEDIIILAWLIDKYGKNPDDYEEADWRAVAQLIPGKDHEQSMFKWMSLRNARKSAQKREWFPSEEMHLKQIVQRLGNKSWFEVSKQLYHLEGKRLRIYRSPKHCRQRWACYLDPNVKKGPWKPSEDLILLKEFLSIGKKWSHIAKKLNGRTENAIKNRFTLLLDKKVALCKMIKNPMSDEAYIKNLIENIEIGLMISSSDEPLRHGQVPEGQAQVRSQPAQEAKQEPQVEASEPPKRLKRSMTATETSSSFTRPLPQNDPEDPTSNERKPVIVKVERMTLEKLRQLGKGIVRPAILNSASSQLFFREEQTAELYHREPREIEISDDGIDHIEQSLNLRSNLESDFEYFCRSSEDVIFQ